MRIAFVSTILGYPWGGADALWTRAAEGAVERGDQLLLAVTAVVAAHPRIVELARRGVIIVSRTTPGPTPSLGRRLLGKLGVGGAADAGMISALTRFQPDLVIVSCGGTYDLMTESALCAWLQQHRIRYRIIANFQQEHPNLSAEERTRARDLLAAAEAISFLSQRNLNVTRRHLLHALPHAQVVQIPLRWKPVDVTPWPASPPWRLAAVARLSPEKGLAMLLQAVSSVLEGVPDWTLRIYGRGPEEGYLRELAGHLHLSDRIIFAGFVTELRDVWAENHLMISPALDEGVPMTIPEAMLCGRPVLATCVGGAEEWLVHNETGFLCPAPTLPLMETALREAWSARDRWPAMGRVAAAAAQAHYLNDDFLKVLPPC